MSVGVVIPAAGVGKRMGTKESKQFILFKGVPILLHTLHIFEKHSEVSEIVVVVKEEELERTTTLIRDGGCKKVTKVIVGGKERQESVFEGLQQISTPWVLVHDAVRPFVTYEEITRLLFAVREYKAAVLAVPVKDTIKVINDEGMITMTPDRSRLRAIHTPQAFCREVLLEAHTQAKGQEPAASDDAALVEQMDVLVKVVEGEHTNIKITTPEDILVAEVMHQIVCKNIC